MKDTVRMRVGTGTHRTLHVGIVKSLLLNLIHNEGAARTLVGWTGTDEEAIEAVTADHREVFVLSAECDRQGPDGACLGHAAVPEKER
jgi:hypothetical protein